MDELFQNAVKAGIKFTTEYQNTDVYIVSVPTPYDKFSKKVDACYVVEAVKDVMKVCHKGATVVIESTVSPGTIDKFVRPVIEENGFTIGQDINLVHAPERIIPGNMVYELLHNNRTIGADDKAVGEKVKELYSSFCQGEIVVTDTSTTFVTALACFYLQIPVGHVEAGLRTYNIYSPYPEEFNRQAVSIISQFNFAPTELSKNNLLKEGKKEETIFVTGNTAIDALKTTVREDYTHPDLEWASDSRLIMITAHRRENLGEPMKHMFRAIRRVMDEHPDVKAIYPIHMNPVVREIADSILGDDERIRIIEPLEVLDFHNFLNRSYMILTDSGGIQEEAPSLGKPVLVMRDTTERPEGIAAGTLKLVGTEEETIYQNFKSLLENKDEYEKMSKASNP